jgi:hypothetical protein
MNEHIFESRAVRRFDELKTTRGFQNTICPDITLQSTKDVGLFIASHPGTYLEEIIQHAFFKDMSRSTIKRGLVELLDKGYVDKSRTTKDLRITTLFWIMPL